MPLYNYKCPNCAHEMKDVLCKYETIIHCDVCKCVSDRQISGNFAIHGSGLTINNKELARNKDKTAKNCS